jgi:Ca2+-binding RTX toxin-like protein
VWPAADSSRWTPKQVWSTRPFHTTSRARPGSATNLTDPNTWASPPTTSSSSSIDHDLLALRSDQEPLWIARNFDSTYAVGISDAAVFIGGHFCWVESELAPDPYPGDGEFTNANSCFGATPAGRFAPEVVNRDQIAALDPATGHALPWDPGSDGLKDVQSIEVIGRGLLVGHDGTFFGRDGAARRAWNVGRHGFFDTSAPNGKMNALFIDQPVVGTCHGLVPTLTGTSQDDVLVGTDGDDVILAGPGRDTIDGASGNDVICGGRDNDTIRGGAGDDILYGNEGADLLIGGFGNDDLRGGYWKDTLLGGPGNDIMRGGRGSDVLKGGSGNDIGYGNDGMDQLNGGSGNDKMYGQQGRDQVEGSSGSDVVDGGIGRDRCAGALFGRTDNRGDTKRACEGT